MKEFKIESKYGPRFSILDSGNLMIQTSVYDTSPVLTIAEKWALLEWLQAHASEIEYGSEAKPGEKP